MKRIMLIGDIHGQFEIYFKIIEQIDCDYSIQLGDMGIGFPDTQIEYNSIFPIENKHKFIRGNHDNPLVCQNHQHYLGDFGINKDGIFLVGGGNSIDKEWRTPFVDWWPDEELSYQQFNQIIDLYSKEKPEYVITHAPPLELLPLTSQFNFIDENNTSKCFSEMLKIHKPKKWIFAHMHTNFNQIVDSVNFICVDQYSYYILEI